MYSRQPFVIARFLSLSHVSNYFFIQFLLRDEASLWNVCINGAFPVKLLNLQVVMNSITFINCQGSVKQRRLQHSPGYTKSVKNMLYRYKIETTICYIVGLYLYFHKNFVHKQILFTVSFVSVIFSWYLLQEDDRISKLLLNLLNQPGHKKADWEKPYLLKSYGRVIII